LDFNRDLRRGDRFSVLFDEVYLDGQRDDVGRVQAMIYETRGVRHEAFLFDPGDGAGYYDSQGRPLQKMFLRSPLPFMRVTSRFSHRRFHPVLKRYRPHYGVDFGAPRGTPIRSTASGTVTVASRQGGAGKMVKIRHANGYETLYLHLSKYSQGIRKGARVAQGDVIGFVGSTGLSTGPHLDYRVKRHGRYLDPMRLENKPAQPIPSDQRLLFEQKRDEYLARMGRQDEGMRFALSGPSRISGSDEVGP
ncbi:MAG: M23 family metallopeptidase, partial [Acidobacteriota bacterium]